MKLTGLFRRKPPVIHTTRAEMNTEAFWARHIDPISREHGIERPTQMNNGYPDDPDTHMLKHPDGRVLLIIRTDREDA